MRLLQSAIQEIGNNWSYFFYSISHPSWDNAFYWLIGISTVIYILELIFPWRKEQKKIRKDFFLDAFYMFFNYFFFYMIGFAAIAYLGEQFFLNISRSLGIGDLWFIRMNSLPLIVQLLIYFLVVDLCHYLIHRLLHRVPFLWNFHKVHHSVKEMGFAAHLRFHWMEGVIYKTLQYIPIALIGGFQLELIFIVYNIQTIIGHLNHANIKINYGPLKYLINNPEMHIWHHSKQLPEGSHGVNFGISLSIWDYIFKTNYIPKDGRDIKLGFQDVESYPKSFWGQFIAPFKRNPKN